MTTEFKETTEEELAQQQPRRRGRPPGSKNQPANGANVGEVPQISLDDEYLTDEELVAALQGKLNDLGQKLELAESEFAKPYIDAHKSLPTLRKEISDRCPRTGMSTGTGWTAGSSR